MFNDLKALSSKNKNSSPLPETAQARREELKLLTNEFLEWAAKYYNESVEEVYQRDIKPKIINTLVNMKWKKKLEEKLGDELKNKWTSTEDEIITEPGDAPDDMSGTGGRFTPKPVPPAPPAPNMEQEAGKVRNLEQIERLIQQQEKKVEAKMARMQEKVKGIHEEVQANMKKIDENMQKEMQSLKQQIGEQGQTYKQLLDFIKQQSQLQQQELSDWRKSLTEEVTQALQQRNGEQDRAQERASNYPDAANSNHQYGYQALGEPPQFNMNPNNQPRNFSRRGQVSNNPENGYHRNSINENVGNQSSYKKDFEEKDHTLLKSMVLTGKEDNLEAKIDALFESLRFRAELLTEKGVRRLIHFTVIHLLQDDLKGRLAGSYESIDGLEQAVRGAVNPPKALRVIEEELISLNQEGSIHDYILRLTSWGAEFVRSYKREIGHSNPEREAERKMLNQLIKGSKGQYGRILLSNQPHSWAEAQQLVAKAILQNTAEENVMFANEWSRKGTDNRKRDKKENNRQGYENEQQDTMVDTMKKLVLLWTRRDQRERKKEKPTTASYKNAASQGRKKQWQNRDKMNSEKTQKVMLMEEEEDNAEERQYLETLGIDVCESKNQEGSSEDESEYDPTE